MVVLVVGILEEVLEILGVVLARIAAIPEVLVAIPEEVSKMVAVALTNLLVQAGLGAILVLEASEVIKLVGLVVLAILLEVSEAVMLVVSTLNKTLNKVALTPTLTEVA